jgi:L-iditol 2-dehydrogenase
VNQGNQHRALQLTATRQMRVALVPTPEPGHGEVLLRITSVGVCGSDVHNFRSMHIGDQALEPPFVLGHEFAGHIVALGPGVTGLEIGQLVAADPAIPCHHCRDCLEGNPNFCRNLEFCSHYPRSGAFQELLPHPAEAVFALPPDMTADDAAMLEPLGVALHSVDLGKPRPGESVGVLGAGTIGLLTMQVARLTGPSRVFVTDKLAYRLEYARDLGADDAFLADGREAKAILGATGGRGCDVVFEATNNPDADVVQTAVEIAEPGGTVVLCGIPEHDEISFTASTARRKGLTIRLVRRMKNTYPRTIALVERGLVDVRGIVTHHFPLDEGQRAFELAADYANGVVKAIIHPHE